MYKILLVEDDEALCRNIADGLHKWSYETAVVNHFENITAEFVNSKAHLVLMDINLPYFDGFYWCNKIRELSKVPIVFLSSRDTNMDIMMAINNGGDDYITKPFSMDILITKIHALLRRAYAYHDDAVDLIECDGVILDLTDHLLHYQEQKIELTRNEFKIMVLLMKNRGKTISRERIMRALWEDDTFINDNTLTVNINRLRSRLTDIGLKDYIITKKGNGYTIK
ncbi:response regulator transcription factor [Bacillaceae bacterium Marseille-Q3522]|nr:response regulator transcription factor [Bacillaceae bacterium Marseille-Q3522]